MKLHPDILGHIARPVDDTAIRGNFRRVRGCVQPNPHLTHALCWLAVVATALSLGALFARAF